MDINAVCERTEQAEALSCLCRKGISRIYSPEDLLPYVFRNEDAGKCRSFLNREYLLVRNIDEAGYLRENGYKGEMRADHTLYTFNKASREFMKGLGFGSDTAPLELNHHELKTRGMRDTELMIYGRVPMMISAGCAYKNSNNDRCCKELHSKDKTFISSDMKHMVRLTDRKNAEFPVICDCRYCYNIILNSVPISLHNDMDGILALDPASVRLYFTTEKPDACVRTAEFFIALLSSGGDRTAAGDPPYKEYTKGHFYKGVD